MTIRANAMIQRQEEEKNRRNLLDSILNKAFKFTEELRNPTTDEEFLDKFCSLKGLSNFNLLNEIQLANYDGIISAFGVKPSPEVESRWRELNDEIAANGVLFNRMGMIANPLYCEVNNLDEFHELSLYLSEDGNTDVFNNANLNYGLKEPSACEIGQRPEKIVEWRNNKKGCKYQFIPKSDLQKAVGFGFTKETLFSVVSSVKIPGILKESLNIPKEKIQYKDLDGNVLDLYGAYEKMHDGKTIKIHNSENNKYVCSLSGGSFDKWGCLKEPTVPANYKVDEANVEELQHNMKGLNNEINSTTHWYIKSSQEFKDFRLAMRELEKDGAFDDRNKAKQDMKHIVDLANAYIKKK